MENFKKRKPNRLKDFNYSSEGAYFLTICTNDRINYLSKIEEDSVMLTPIGNEVKSQLLSLEDRFKSVRIIDYVIMPNHIHLIMEISSGGASPSPTVSSIIGAFKSLTTRQVRQDYGVSKLFQRSFYDHVIRDEKDYQEKAKYILENPMKWYLDELYNEAT